MKHLSPIEKQRGEQLAQFLNGELEAHQEIGRLLEWCQEVYSLYEKRPPLSHSAERIAYEKQLANLRSDINSQVLYKFQVVPRLEASEQGLATAWTSVQPLHPYEVERLRACEALGLQPITAHSAVHVILDMTTAGTIDRIRQCENPACHKWLLAISNKKVTCNDACRSAKYEAKQGSRANDMRRSRELHKNQPQLKKQKGRKSHGARKG